MQNQKDTILVVDDQAQNLQLVATVLKDHYKLILATDGHNAIEVAKEKRPDLILLDIMMPDFSGIDTCRKLKEIEETSEIPVIFLTAKTEEEDIIEAYESGGVDYVSKPFKSRELLARIQSHLSLKKQRDEIKKLNKELAASNLQKNKLFSILAHDLRGPANTILASLEILSERRKELKEEDILKFIEGLRLNSQNLKELLEDLLTWSRRQFEKLKFEPKGLNLIESVDKVFDQISSQANSKNIRLSYDTNDDLNIRADKDMFTTILRNLLANAIKFSNKGSTIQVRSRKTEQNMISISVVDRGQGIKEEDLPKIFDSTILFTTYGTMGEKGTGIGLDMCKEFVEKHGGEIKVDSEVGVGSTFTFTMPAFL